MHVTAVTHIIHYVRLFVVRSGTLLAAVNYDVWVASGIQAGESKVFPLPSAGSMHSTVQTRTYEETDRRTNRRALADVTVPHIEHIRTQLLRISHISHVYIYT